MVAGTSSIQLMRLRNTMMNIILRSDGTRVEGVPTNNVHTSIFLGEPL